MILIDSIYINCGGGLILLKYLLSELKLREIGFCLLADDRCLGQFDEYAHVCYLKASIKNRRKYYKQIGKEFTCVLCFGNMPPPCKLDIPVYTYFHNILLLTLQNLPSKIEMVKSWIKRGMFNHYKRNTDYWIVQTSNTASELALHLKEDQTRILIKPFYQLSEDLCNVKKRQHGDDYAFVGLYSGSKGHEQLLEAWEILRKKGLNKKLHLTVQGDKREFIDKIEKAQSDGVNMINHGYITFDKVIDIYRQSKALIYPSFNESFGLGIIEAIHAGCDVIGSDLPYLYSVCKPSETFNPFSPESIANAVLEYEKGVSPHSVPVISNQIDEFIDLLK